MILPVLLAEAGSQAGEKDFIKAAKKEKLQNLKTPAFIFVGLLMIVFAVVRAIPVLSNTFFITGFSLLLLLNLAGVIVTTFLLLYEADKTNPALQKICTAGTKTNCNAILNSKEAKLFNWLSWSEIGSFYFAGNLLFLLFAANASSAYQSTLQLIQLFNILALPYVFFSIYYQWRVAKQWCPLCLTVQAILVLQFITCISAGLLNEASVSSLIKLRILSTLLPAYTLPILFWLIVKPLLYYKQKAKQDYRSLQRLKFNTEIFTALLEKQKRLTEPANDLGISLGNPQAANTLIKVCNPYCGPCAKAHPEIEKLLEETDNLKVQIIFTATNDEKDIRALPVKHLLAISEQDNEAISKQALDDWYLAEKKDPASPAGRYEAFAERYPMNGELDEQDEKIEAMCKWCDNMEIAFTPTIFFNGHQLPEVYGIGDVKYFLAE